MDIFRITDVDRDGHAGLRQFEGLQHRFTDARPAFASGKVRELHPGERNLVGPERAPARDEPGELLVVKFARLARVAFALIPEDAT